MRGRIPDIEDINFYSEGVSFPQDYLWHPIPTDIKHVDLPRFLVEADHLINVPIFKTHVSMVFTCALKNLKGVVQDRTHYLMHTTNLANAMMDLGELLQEKVFTIADLYQPMEGFGPHSGTPVNFGCILAGKDLVAVDATACRLVGLDVEKVDYFKAAQEKGLGNFNVEVMGIEIGYGKLNYKNYLIKQDYRFLFVIFLQEQASGIK